MEYTEFKGKTKNDAITEACRYFSIPSDKLEYEVIDEGKAGLFGIGSKPAIIKAKVKEEKVEDKKEVIEPVKITSVTETAVKSDKTKTGVEIDVEAVSRKFLNDVFAAMGIKVDVETKYNESLKNLDVELSGDEMGVLIGKRGQTLDSLQYLISLVVNKGTGEYIRVKVDTENYRQRRKETLENLAKNIAYKVKRTRKPVSLEPMNPYERRIIHAALQNDRYVTTHSEGDEPFRRVVVTPKKENGYKGNYNGNRSGYNKGSYNKGYNKSYNNRGGYSNRYAKTENDGSDENNNEVQETNE
jgi:spoIIIJ-associated protein